MVEGVGPPRTPEEMLRAFDLKETAPDHFMGRTPGWFSDRLFGGIVVAQALMAGIRSIEPHQPGPALRPHSLHCYFLRPVLPDTEVDFEVEPLRDSRSFAVRQVTTVQEGRPAARVMCSFHVDEIGEVEYQLSPPTDLAPPEQLQGWDTDVPYELRIGEPVPAEDGTYLASGRHWVRMKGELPDDPAVHCCLLAQFSDQSRLSFRPRSLYSWGTHTDASLDHAVWFHRPARVDQWLRYELQTLVNHGNRSTVRGTMYDRQGTLVMSMAQELLIRPIPGAVEQDPPWLGALRSTTENYEA